MSEKNALERRREIEKKFKAELKEEEDRLRPIFGSCTRGEEGIPIMAAINLALKHDAQKFRDGQRKRLSEEPSERAKKYIKDFEERLRKGEVI